MSIEIAKTYIEVPPPPPYEGGLFSVANIVPATGHALLGAEYMTDACTEGALWTEICYSVNRAFCDDVTIPTPPLDGYKTFGEPSLVEGSPIAVYDGVECRAIGGGSDAEGEAQAKRRLAYSEQRQVELYLPAIMTGPAVQVENIVSASVADAIMQFEAIAVLTYGGVATILMSRPYAVCAYSQRLIERAFDGSLQTVNGTRVAAIAANPGEEDNLFLTGQITLLQGPVIAHAVHEVVRPDGTCDPRRVLAERMYVPLIECMVVATTAPCEVITP